MTPQVAGTIWWDFDGTLVSRPAMWSEAGHRLLSAQRPDLDISREQVGLMLRTGFPWHNPDCAHPELCEPEAWWDAVYRRYRLLFAECGCADLESETSFESIRQHVTDAAGYRLFDDVVPVLDRLRQRGWRQLIVSNHVPELPEIVAALGIGGFFDAVVTSALVGYEKPHSVMFAAARSLTTASGPIWMVGDNPEADCRSAVRFGVNAVLARSEEGFEPQVSSLLDLELMLEV